MAETSCVELAGTTEVGRLLIGGMHESGVFEATEYLGSPRPGDVQRLEQLLVGGAGWSMSYEIPDRKPFRGTEFGCGGREPIGNHGLLRAAENDFSCRCEDLTRVTSALFDYSVPVGDDPYPRFSIIDVCSGQPCLEEIPGRGLVQGAER